ncbi:hypothetical protein BH23PSE2_BH23PSE2_11770 [soil metagenome]
MIEFHPQFTLVHVAMVLAGGALFAPHPMGVLHGRLD